MKEYTVRPTSKGQRILTNDLVIIAGSSYAAKEKAKGICPGCEDYVIVDIEHTGWAGIQRQRERAGFGM